MSDPAPPRPDDDVVDRRRAPSLVLVNTGDGKGKSTAAFGTLLRAVARGWRCAVVRFVAAGDWHASEEQVLTDLGVDWWSPPVGAATDDGDVDDPARAAAVAAWEQACDRIAAGEYDVLVLDEITYPMTWGWISVTDVVEAIGDRPEHVHIICTGRDAPYRLVEIADTVTRMDAVKHAFDAGIMARRGIDY